MSSKDSAPTEEELKANAKQNIQAYAFRMKTSLDDGKLMDALKHASGERPGVQEEGQRARTLAASFFSFFFLFFSLSPSSCFSLPLIALFLSRDAQRAPDEPAVPQDVL